MTWKREGIAPRRLLAQVENTASWALDGDADDPASSFRRALRDAAAIEDEAAEGADVRLRYFALLLAAHHVTCATFVPTDVDTRIRHHFFEDVADEATLLAACDVIDEADGWDVASVSARTVQRGDLGVLAGHDGEWFSVRAGALGRALALGAHAAAARLEAALDAEVEREREFLRRFAKERDALGVLRTISVVAHNLGDLSRVVEAWPKGAARTEELRVRYTRLGHLTTPRDPFAAAGRINKALLADENHRFLPLREARALRRSRAHLLPIGPFFEGWGRGIGRDETFEEKELGEIVSALLEVHVRRATEEGCLRALAGLDAGLRGGLGRITGLVPARARKMLAQGAVRDALKLSEDRFRDRFVNRFEKLGGFSAFG